MKKQMKKLALAKETLQVLETGKGVIIGADDTKSVYWSCVCTNSGMYTCLCPGQSIRVTQ